jgi:hypothetical protein
MFARHLPIRLQPLSMEGSHVADVVGKVGDILVAQLKLAARLAAAG